MKTVKDIFTDEEAPILALLWAITKTYGKECYEWEPQILRNEIEEDFDCKLSDLQSDKIQAGIVILTTENYESNIKVFETLNYLLNNQPDDIDTLNPLEAEELICGLTEAYLIRNEKITFSPEIRVYAGKIFYDYGMHKPPILFPEAIMDEKDGDDSEKNAALDELFQAKILAVTNYMKECKK